MLKSLVALILAMLSTLTLADSWTYRSNKDPMSGKETKTATIISTNSLNFSWPYSGRNHGFIQVRQHPQYGLDVLVSVQQGQIMCRSNDCKVRVKFGDKQPVTYNATEPADNSSNLVFINNETAFINNARSANRILVELTFFQNGIHILEFEAKQPLNWK